MSGGPGAIAPGPPAPEIRGGQIWAREPAYILSICSAKLVSTLRRLIFIDGVISPSSMLRSRGRMANFLIVSQRFSLPLSSSM